MNRIFSKIKKAIQDPAKIILYCTKYRVFRLVPDRIYLKMVFRLSMKKKLNLDAPKTFNQKMQWLKLYDRNPKYTDMADKFVAKKVVAERIGEEHIIPTFGAWDSFDEIEFDKLPNRFVLKCTHDSGGLIIVRDKSKFDREAARKKLNNCLKRDYYYQWREWPYKDIPKKILAEAYMENQNGEPIRDYKFYCFNGETKFLYISEGLEDHATAKISFVTLDWKFAPYERSDYKTFDKLPSKPARFDEMVSLAQKLSEGIKFLRVDFYQIDGVVYFSELTFFPCGGMIPFREKMHDLELGDMLKL